MNPPLTPRIYYSEPGCRAFDAVVTRALEHDGRPAVLLDRTAFYPTSGGQPFDTGHLRRLGPNDPNAPNAVNDPNDPNGPNDPNAVAVIDVVDLDGDVMHIVESPIGEGTPVHGEIDWPRRLDHMQQHTGQHVLSAAFDRLFDNRTMSFHMGGEVSTIDLARELTAAQIEQAVDEANRIVWENHPVSIRFASEEEARALPLRKEPAREGQLRLIEIAGFDISACGGTHVDRTGAIGLIGVVGSERFKGGTRLTFVCGGRALRALRTNHDIVVGCVRELSVLPHELPSAVARIQGEAKQLRKAVAKLQESLAVHEANRLFGEAPDSSGRRVIVQVYEGWDAPGLKAIAAALAAKHGVAAALLSAGAPVLIVVARSQGVGVDANAVVRQLTERFGGRGGGKPDLAQAGGLEGTADAIVAVALDLLRG